MKSKGLRLYGANDIRLEEFDLPEIKDDEILVKVMSDSICMSTYKLLVQGKAHKRCPQNVDTNSIIIGHEFAQQPALNYKGSLASPGEPMSRIVGGYYGNDHTNKVNHEHSIGIKEGSSVLIMGGCGPMGLGAIEYPLALEKKPAMVVVTDMSDGRIARARLLIPEEEAAKHGIRLVYINPNDYGDNQFQALMDLTGGKGYDDIFVYAPIVPWPRWPTSCWASTAA